MKFNLDKLPHILVKNRDKLPPSLSQPNLPTSTQPQTVDDEDEDYI